MQAFVIHGHGDVDMLEPAVLPVPEPGPGEVLVKVEACGLNHLDLWVRKGLPGLKLEYPHILGADVAGELPDGTKVVVNAGISCMKCQRCLSGQDNLCRSYALLGEHRRGGNAQYVVVPEANIVPRPANVSAVEGAAIPVTFTTAWQMLVLKARVQAGETVLVIGAGSGVGSVGVQIAKLRGARVIATATSDDKLEKAWKLGADETVQTGKQDLVETVHKLTGRRGVDVVFEHVGKAVWPDVIKVCAKGARLVTCGATTGFDVSCDLRHIFFKQISILGSTMAPKGVLFDVVEQVAQGRLKPVVDRVLPLSQIREAHRLLEARGAFGKIVLEVP
jgi:NADPH:quinone reductase-like Zn-dependent oxidoreductase